MADYHIAQLNIGRMLGSIDDPVMADFANNLDRINALADTAEGFVWRLQTDDGDATAIRAFEDELLIVNMSVWETIDALHQYTYKTVHAEFIGRRKEWFSKMSDMHMVLWWVEAGHIPTVEEAKSKLEHLNAHGATPQAFTFTKRFTAEEMLQSTS